MLGQAAGLIGLTLFAVEFFLKSYPNLLKKHHVVGGIAFILLMLHPLFLNYSIFPTDYWQVNLGIISLVIMMVLLLLTFFIVLPYKYWKLTHKFMGLAFIIGAAHSLLVYSTIPWDLPLKIYLIVVTIFGLFFYFKPR